MPVIDLNLDGLSAADLDILFEPNPYSYDSSVTDPSLPPSPFIQVMREQEERFYQTFPEAKRTAEYRQRRKADLLAFLASRNPNSRIFSPHFTFQPYPSPRIHPGHGPDPQVTITSSYGSPPLLNHPSPPHIYDDVPDLVPAIPSMHYHNHHLHDRDSHVKEHEPQSQHFSTIVPRPQLRPHPPHHDRQPGRPRSPEQDSASRRASDYSTGITRDRGDRRSRSRAPTPAPSQSSRSRSNKNPTSSKGLSWGSKRRAGTRASPAPGKRQQSDRKPTLACLFCRGRKIACGAPPPGSDEKTCNQCLRRSLRCEFPAESRRGMRKRKVFKGSDDGPDDLPGESILLP